MLAEKPVTHRGNGGALPFARGLDRQIAFGIGTHRPIVEVRRTHAQETVIDDHDL